MEWTVELPRTVAEDDRASVSVEADTIEEAIMKASAQWGLGKRPVGQVFSVRARVKVIEQSVLPLRSV